MRHRQSILVILFLNILIYSANAQNISDDLFKMNRAYLNFQDLSMNITYMLFPNHSAVTPLQVERGFFRKHNKSQYSNMMGVETLSTENFLITTDTADKEIIITNPIKQEKLFIPKTDIESYVKKCSKVESIKPSPTQLGYKLTADERNSEYSEMIICLNKKTYLVEKIVLYVNQAYKMTAIERENDNSSKQKPRLEIIFSNINTQPKFSEKDFSEGQFFESVNDEFVPAKKYTGYNIVNTKI